MLLFLTAGTVWAEQIWATAAQGAFMAQSLHSRSEGVPFVGR